MRPRRLDPSLRATISRAVLALSAATVAVLLLAGAILATDAAPGGGCDGEPEATLVTAYDPAARTYLVRAVVLSGVTAACDGGSFSVSLADGRNAPLGATAYRDAAGPDGQVNSRAGAAQRVRLELAGQRIPAASVVLVAVEVR